MDAPQNGSALRTALAILGSVFILLCLGTCAVAVVNSQNVKSLDARLKVIEERDEQNRTLDRVIPQRYGRPPDAQPGTAQWH